MVVAGSTATVATDKLGTNASTETRRNVKRAMFGDAFGRQGRAGRVVKNGKAPASREEARKGV